MLLGVAWHSGKVSECAFTTSCASREVGNTCSMAEKASTCTTWLIIDESVRLMLLLHSVSHLNPPFCICSHKRTHGFATCSPHMYPRLHSPPPSQFGACVPLLTSFSCLFVTQGGVWRCLLALPSKCTCMHHLHLAVCLRLPLLLLQMNTTPIKALLIWQTVLSTWWGT